MDEKRLYQMIRLAHYAQYDGKEDLKLRKYYRGDYIGFALLRTFFLVTIGYVLVVMGIFLYNYEVLMDNLYTLDIQPIIFGLIVGYIVTMAFYMALAVIICSVRYRKSEKNIRKYHAQLQKLEE